MPAIPKRNEAATSSRVSSLPAHIDVRGGALAKIKALTELSKTTPLQVITLSDSNGTPGTFTPDTWDRGNFARILDRRLAWTRGNTTAVSEAVLGPQLQVIKFSTMGNSPVNSAVDTPWHPKSRKLIFEPRTILGPFGQSYKSLGGITAFDDPAKTNRQIGFLIDRTSSGDDWERNMDQVAVGYFGRGNSDQVIGITTNGAVKADGTNFAGTNYSGLYSTFTLSIHDVTGIDFSTIPTSGWDETNAACIAIKAACSAVGATATLTINPAFGAGAAMPGYLSNWLGGMTADKKWLIKLATPDASTMGAWLEYLVLRNSSITGGAHVWDMAYSGNALNHCEWKRYNNDGSPDPTWSSEPGDFLTDTYVRSELCARLLMRGENSYGSITNFSNKSAWSSATHNMPGLHVAIINLFVNDLNSSFAMPQVMFNHAYNLIQQVVRVNPGAVVIFNLPPCPGYAGGDNIRDNHFTGTGGARAKDSTFRDQIKSASASFPNNAVVIDYQAKYGNIAPTVLKSRIGHFGTFKREASDPIDIDHFKVSTWQAPSAQDISDLFSSWCYV